MITASQSFKIFELLNKHFKNQEDAKALVTEIESVIDAKFEDTKVPLATKEDLIREISPVKADLLVVKWMMGFILAGIASLIVKSFF
jgi:hemerythrin